MGILRSHLLLLLLVASSAAGSLLRTVPKEPSTISFGGDGGGGGDPLYCDSWRLSVEMNDAGPWMRVPARCIEFVAEYMNGERYTSDSEVIAGEALAFAEAVLWPPRDLARLWLVLWPPRAWNELNSRLHVLHTKAPSAAPRVAFFLLRIASSIALVWVDESDSNRELYQLKPQLTLELGSQGTNHDLLLQAPDNHVESFPSCGLTVLNITNFCVMEVKSRTKFVFLRISDAQEKLCSVD